MNSVSCLAPDCGGETGEEENVESDIQGQLKEMRVMEGRAD